MRFSSSLHFELRGVLLTDAKTTVLENRRHFESQLCQSQVPTPWVRSSPSARQLVFFCANVIDGRLRYSYQVDHPLVPVSHSPSSVQQGTEICQNAC